MSSEDNHFHDRRFGLAHLRGNWTMLYTSWDYLLNPDSIAIDHDFGISYNGGPFHGNASFKDHEMYGGPAIILAFSSYSPDNPVERYIFRSILGTDNWLHRPPSRPLYTCILMPQVDRTDGHERRDSSDMSSDDSATPSLRESINARIRFAEHLHNSN